MVLQAKSRLITLMISCEICFGKSCWIQRLEPHFQCGPMFFFFHQPFFSRVFSKFQQHTASCTTASAGNHYTCSQTKKRKHQMQDKCNVINLILLYKFSCLLSSSCFLSVKLATPSCRKGGVVRISGDLGQLQRGAARAGEVSSGFFGRKTGLNKRTGGTQMEKKKYMDGGREGTRFFVLLPLPS